MTIQHLFRLVLIAGFGLLLTGCADEPAKQGTYTAARHKMIGSNIPQPDSAASASTTYDASAGTGANLNGNAQRSVGRIGH